ncbi:hypothetical protein D9M71_174410 [compost metagenome]
MTLLSSSVCSPCSCSSTCLPSRAETSCTSRGKRLKMKPTGSMRIDITDSCRSRVLCSSWARACCRRSCRAGSSSAPSWPSMAWVITSSPTRLIRLSIFSTPTRIELDSASVRATVFTDALSVFSGVATAAGTGLPGASSKKPKSSSCVAAGAPGASSKKPKPSSCGCSSQARRPSRVACTGRVGSGRCSRWASSRRCSRSRVSRNSATISAFRRMRPQRMRSSRVSSSWVTALRSS